MIGELITKEVKMVFGRRKLICHLAGAFKEGAKLGGMAACMTFERITHHDDYLKKKFPNENIRDALLKGACGLMVGICIETAVHTMEYLSGTEC